MSAAIKRFFELDRAYFDKFVRERGEEPMSSLVPPSLYSDPRLPAMLEQALRTGEPIAKADIDLIFGKDRWEEVR